jgi:hypothetical protein
MGTHPNCSCYLKANVIIKERRGQRNEIAHKRIVVA